MWPQENSRYNTGTKPAGGGGSSRVRRSRLGEFQASDIGKHLYQVRIRATVFLPQSKEYAPHATTRNGPMHARKGRAVSLLLSRIDYVGRQSRERIENDGGS